MRKRRYKRSSAQLGFEPFIAPEGFTKPEQWKEYGLTVDIFSKFSSYKNPYKSCILNVSDSASSNAFFTPTSGCSCTYGYTLNGIEYSIDSTHGFITWSPEQKNRWVIFNNIPSVVLTSVETPFIYGRMYNIEDSGVRSIKNVFLTSRNDLLPKNGFYFANAVPLTGVINFYNTIAIPSYSFQNANKIYKIVFYDCLISIGVNTFSNCTSINQDLITPINLNSIGNTAFNNCTSLKSITFNNSLETLGSQAFYGCTALTSFQVPPNLIPTTGLGGGVISNTNIPVANVTSLSLIYTVGASGTVGYGCIFEEVGGVKKRAISAPKTFAGLSGSLDLATYASGLTSIDAYAFFYCNLVTSISLPNSVTTIGNYAFDLEGYNSNSRSVIGLTGNITSLGVAAFRNNRGTIDISNLTGIDTIQGSTFVYCTNIVGTIPNNVKNIGRQAFGGSSISSVTIPSDFNSFALDVFLNCVNLSTITFLKTTDITNMDASVFAGCVNVNTLNLPVGYTATYNTWNFSQKLALTTTTADALAQSMINIAAGTAGNVKVIHIGATNKTNLLANGTPALIATMNANLTANYKQLNASDTTLSVATTGVAITSITVASTAGYLSAGKILLGSTTITYTSITATTFVFASVVVPAYSVGTTVSEV